MRKKQKPVDPALAAAHDAMIDYVADGRYADRDRAKAEVWALERHRLRHAAVCGPEAFMRHFRERLDATDRFAAFMGEPSVRPVVARGVR